MRSFLTLILFALATGLFAQVDLPLTKRAASECNAGELDRALKTMEIAMASEEKTHPFCWYVLGFIHKELYVKQDQSSMTSPHREQAETAIQTSMELDRDGAYAENNANALRFLAITHYNDALRLTKTFVAANAGNPNLQWVRFQEMMQVVDPAYDYTENATDFYKHMARGFNRLYLDSDTEEQNYLDQSTSFYKQALELSPEDYKANYNLAINYYNLGVKRIKQISHKTDIFELLRIQDECVVLFQLALPYMQHAHAQLPDRIETLKGMMAIHRALSNRELSDQFREQLREVLGEE